MSEIVNEYESRLPLNREEYILLEQTREDMEEKLTETVKGMIFRSKVRWYEDGEKNTKYFYALEKARYNAKTCYQLITEDGKEIEDPQKILEKQKEFYKELYKEDKDVAFNMTNQYNIKVPEEIRIQQEKLLTTERDSRKQSRV